jgi:Ca-activated chloride channel family protein
MLGSAARDAWLGPPELLERRKFGLRTMKSLRKIAFAALATLPAYAVYLAAQTAGQSAPAQAAPASGGTQSVPAQSARPVPTGPPQSEERAKISVNSNLVILPVTVKDRSGNIVPDLRRDEFRVFEDNVEQKIDVFTAEAFPLSMIILLDNDLKEKDAHEVRKSLDAVVGGLSLDDEAFICRFDQFFHPGPGFTSDHDLLLTELQRTTLDSEPSVAPPGGAIANAPSINGHSAIGDAPNIASATMAIRGQSTKALDDAVFGAAQLLRDRSRNRRKLILLISDGANGGKKSNKMNYDSVVKTLLHDNIEVFSVAVASAFLERKLSRLVDYAHDSGGEVYFAAKRETLEELYSRISEEARNQYTIAYVPRGTDRTADFHSVEVRVRREGLTIKTRDRYYSGEVPGATPQ